MPPNTVDIPPVELPKFTAPESPPKQTLTGNYYVHISQATLNMLGRLCIGIVVGFNLAFAFRNGLPLNKTNLHIVLCVMGYQLLMAEACLVLAPGTWAERLSLKDKRRIHWILQLVGSALAIAGTIIKSMDNRTNWNTLHGKFALVAVTATIISLINGLTSLYAYELRRFIPASISKLSHICLGIVAFLTATISLIYGMKYNSFRNWSGTSHDTLIWFTIFLALIPNINPLITFGQKFWGAIRRN